MISDIINYLQVRPGLGTAGQPSASEFAGIQAEGYQVVINLVPSSSPDALADEAAVVTGLGMDYIHIPVIWQEPSRVDLEQFFKVMDQNRERKVFVHCVMNMRVSAFVFLYRVTQEGVPVETARADMLRIWEPNPTWQHFIEECLKPAPFYG